MLPIIDLDMCTRALCQAGFTPITSVWFHLCRRAASKVSRFLTLDSWIYTKKRLEGRKPLASPCDTLFECASMTSRGEKFGTPLVSASLGAKDVENQMVG